MGIKYPKAFHEPSTQHWEKLVSKIPVDLWTPCSSQGVASVSEHSSAVTEVRKWTPFATNTHVKLNMHKASQEIKWRALDLPHDSCKLPRSLRCSARRTSSITAWARPGRARNTPCANAWFALYARLSHSVPEMGDSYTLAQGRQAFLRPESSVHAAQGPIGPQAAWALLEGGECLLIFKHEFRKEFSTDPWFNQPVNIYW